MGEREEIASAAERFALDGRMSDARRHGRGRIHQTWLVECDSGRRYVLQCLNSHVFRDLDAVMQNVVRVCAHLERRLSGRGAPGLQPLRLVPTRAGASWLCQQGGGWRAYEYVEGTRTLERADTPDQAYQAALAFGRFAALLADLPDPPLHETIPGFHDTVARGFALADAVERDTQGRVSGAEREIAALAGHWDLALRIPALCRAGRLQRRVVHNDTKLNNVLFDERTGRAACVIDLDTVMPGYLAYDFGDLVRSAGNSAPEEGADPASAELRMPIFEALAEGYLEGARDVLDAADRESLAFAGPLLAFEVAMRFLTDHLEGDRYFRVANAGQNLERARVQLALLASMRARSTEMERALVRG